MTTAGSNFRPNNSQPGTWRLLPRPIREMIGILIIVQSILSFALQLLADTVNGVESTSSTSFKTRPRFKCRHQHRLSRLTEGCPERNRPQVNLNFPQTQAKMRFATLESFLNPLWQLATPPLPKTRTLHGPC